jgi:nucleotide-binding universal stress UspA family protein
MPIRNILLHLAPDACAGERLAVAVELARRHGARLTALYMMTPAGMPAAIVGRGASAAYIAAAMETAAEEAAAIRQRAEAASATAGVALAWEQLDGDHNALLAARSHYADLIVVSQFHGISMDDYVGVHEPGDLLLQAVCGVLIVPRGHGPRAVGEEILIAWKDTREATRAVREAMPLLQSAKAITLFTCDGSRPTEGAGRELVAYLEQHGLKVRHVSSSADDAHAGAAILAGAAESGADLVVMGAFGRPRWRELVFGGATAHVLAHMTVPVLTAH